MNQYGHIVVRVLVIQDSGLVDVTSTDEYLMSRYESRSRKITLKKRIVDFLVSLLYKL